MNVSLKLFNRLTEVEKIGLRSATPGRIEYLSDTIYRPELGADRPFSERVALLVETQALANLEMATKTAHPTFGLTWKF